MSDLKFTPFSSSIHPGFWSAFSKLKLEVLGLEEKAIEVHGQYENKGQSGIPSFLSIEFDAFDLTKASSTNWCTYSSLGTVFNHNTMESFKKFDKVQYLNIEEGAKLIEAIKSEKVYQDPRILSPFVVHMYADLKKYHYYYWFAFPAIVLPNLKQNQIEVDLDMQNLSKNYSAWKKENPNQSGFFWIDKNRILTLEEGMKEDELILAFADPSTLDEHPGWPLRNLLALLALKRPEKLKKGVKILCYRQKAQNGELSIENSKFLQVFLEDSIEEKDLKITGWEKNDKNQFAPRFANMKSSMDPSNLAENSVDLNLKLMKWRLVPELDLNKFYQTKCLLLGSGTLGCNVARCLLGWGVKNITFLDNSKVSYSNPVRQSLFNFEDCLEGGKAKAQAASEMLKKIFPGVKTSGHNINIPMPGHPISDSLVSKVKQDFEKLEELIQNHDVIFLLMDTRESRWLPTVMGMHYDKLVINAALGFDTFLVMRHGIRTQESWEKFEAKDEIPGCQLGCYFCNDVVAPGDSTKDRTLDQQCTVTRPGVSYQAGAFAVEVMASILQHEKGTMASASIKSNGDEGPLGPTVHSIRGSISSFQISKPTTQRFTHCTACSKNVLEAFTENGFELLLKISKDAKYLEKLTGLDQLMDDSNFDDVIACSDSEDDF